MKWVLIVAIILAAQPTKAPEAHRASEGVSAQIGKQSNSTKSDNQYPANSSPIPQVITIYEGHPAGGKPDTGEAEDHEGIQRKIGIFTGLLVIVGLLQAGVAFLQWRVYQRQAGHVVVTERAWIKAIIHSIEILRGAHPIGVVVGLKNGGKTPGFVFEIGNVIEIIKTKESLPAIPCEYPPEAVFRWEEPGLPLAPEDSHGKWVPKTAQDTERIFNGEDVLWVRGYVKYRDAFSNEPRETCFCFRWIPPRPDVGINAQFLIEGPPAYHRMT